MRDRTRRIGRFVRRNGNAVGAVAGAGCRPARIEAVAAGRARLGIGDGQPVCAPAHGLGQLQRSGGGDGHGGAGNQPVAGDGLIAPFAILLEPLIGRVLAHPAYRQIRQGDALAGLVQGNGLKSGARVLRHRAAVEIGTDADGNVMGADGDIGAALGGAPARLVDGNAHRGFQRQRGLGQRAGIAGDGGDTRRIGLGHHQIHLGLGKTVVHPPEAIAAILRPGIGIDGDGGFAVAGQVRGGRAVQELCLGPDMEILARRNRLFPRAERYFQPLGHKIGDIELHPADRIGLGVDIGADLPAAMRRAGRQIQIPGGASGQKLVATDGDAAHLDPVGALGHQGQRRVQCRAHPVTQHGHGAHRLAGAINAAFGIKPGIDGAGRGMTAHAAIGQIEGRTAQVQEREIAMLAVGHHHHRLIAAGGAHQARIEIGAAIAVGDGAGKLVVVARDQRHAHAGQWSGAAIGTGEHGQPRARRRPVGGETGQ